MREKLKKGFRTLSIASTNALLMANTAFAAPTEESINSTISSVIDMVYISLVSVIVIMALFQMVPAIIHFVQSTNSQNGEARKEAASGIAQSIALLAIAGITLASKPLVVNFLVS